ncbi:MAG: hypothetical protein CVV27_07790 [Candidatus Melainabacteria bacterium HGW-Melainabacteria-1]|nr:MAG: hypothetical protein CVV27_07790 [Candidatus Melainabacteria bacterium HGW-Melainabacteria-1]
MITQVQAFVRPSQSSYYLPQASLHQAVQALDANRDGRLGRDELAISAHLARMIDSNRDGMIQLFEVQDALENDQLSLSQLSYRASDALAASLIRNRVFSAGLGQLGYVVDGDRDGFVSRRELSTALNSGRVVLSGSYLTTVQQPDYPDYPGYPGAGLTLAEARRQIADIENQKMKPDQWGNPNPNTGIFKPEEANARIKAYFDKEIVSAVSLSLSEKFELIKSQRMGRDQWGNYTPSKGSLKDDEAASIAKRSAEKAWAKPFEPQAIRDMLNAVASERQKADQWGNDDPRSGLLKPADANAVIKTLLSNSVIKGHALSRDEKLTIIKEHTMRKDQWGNEMPRTGALTQAEARSLSQQVFDQRNYIPNMPAKPAQGSDAKPNHSQDPFKP